VAPTNVVLALDCPKVESEPQIVKYKNDETTATFSIKCNTDSPYNDLAVFIAYSLSDCLTACAAYNYYLSLENPSGRVCKGAAFANNLQKYSARRGNCFLKNELESRFQNQDMVLGRSSHTTNIQRRQGGPVQLKSSAGSYNVRSLKTIRTLSFYTMQGPCP